MLASSNARTHGRLDMPHKRPHSASGGSGVPTHEKRARSHASGPSSDLSKSIEEARKRAMAAFQRTGLPSAPSAPPPRPRAPTSSPSAVQHNLEDKKQTGEQESKPVGIHPLLLGDAARIQEKFRSLAPKFASIQANKRQIPGKPPPSSSFSSILDAKPIPVKPKNPYLPSEVDRVEGPKPKSMHRALQFHRPGKYILEAEQIRRDEKMNALKERIQATAQKVGLQDELLGDERVLRVRTKSCTAF